MADTGNRFADRFADLDQVRGFAGLALQPRPRPIVTEPQVILRINRARSEVVGVCQTAHGRIWVGTCDQIYHDVGRESPRLTTGGRRAR